MQFSNFAYQLSLPQRTKTEQRASHLDPATLCSGVSVSLYARATVFLSKLRNYSSRFMGFRELYGRGDRIPVGTRFYALAQTGPGAHPAPPKWVPGLSRGYSGRGVALTTHPHLLPRLKKQ